MATMHPLLFLGLGGTGGKVLGVVQNTLSRRLRSVGIHHIPAGIQFLHIDVPAKRDADEGGQAFGLAPTDYFPLTDENFTYSATYTGGPLVDGLAIVNHIQVIFIGIIIVFFFYSV